MANIKFKNLDKYVSQLEHLSSFTELLIGEAVYDGAEIVADATKTALNGLPVDNRRKVPMRKSINQKQKNALIESFGIAKLQRDKNFYNVKTGFDGYNTIVTDRWPLGQPNVMIARSLESGTSFMPKNPIISKATRNAKKRCEEAMQNSLTKNINKLMK